LLRVYSYSLNIAGGPVAHFLHEYFTYTSGRQIIGGKAKNVYCQYLQGDGELYVSQKGFHLPINPAELPINARNIKGRPLWSRVLSASSTAPEEERPL
jgi:hypothetical protein